jgi:hypothetical protein
MAFFGLQNINAFQSFFPSTLNIMILRIVENECQGFGEHVNIEVSYKILPLEVPKEISILHNPLCFQ